MGIGDNWERLKKELTVVQIPLTFPKVLTANADTLVVVVPVVSFQEQFLIGNIPKSTLLREDDDDDTDVWTGANTTTEFSFL